MSEVYVGRQPIYSRKLKVVGYELLYRRGSDSSSAEFSDENSATSDVIINAFVNIGLEKLVGGKLAFINLSKEFFSGEYSLPLPTAGVVLEVLEDIRVDDTLVSAVRRYADQGYRIALDDVVDPGGLEPLLEIVSIAKIDIRQLRSEALAHCVARIKGFGVKVLAEKIENMEEYDFCARLGFDYYQGFFLERPRIIKGQSLPASTLTIMRLLSRLQSPEIDFEGIKEIVRQDVSMSFMLLRLVNSAYYSLNKEIDSIGDALVMLGMDRIRSWLSLLLISRMDDKPPELIVTAMVRARMCEILSRSIEEDMGSAGFMTGLFSVLESLLGLPMNEILEMLPLKSEIKAALLGREGRLGEVLACVLDYEHWNWDSIGGSPFPPDFLNDAYIDSLEWATGAGSIAGL